MSPNSPATSGDRLIFPRVALLVSAALTALGIVLAGTVAGPLGGALTLVGWVGFALSLHAYGRAGGAGH